MCIHVVLIVNCSSSDLRQFLSLVCSKAIWRRLPSLEHVSHWLLLLDHGRVFYFFMVQSCMRNMAATSPSSRVWGSTKKLAIHPQKHLVPWSGFSSTTPLRWLRGRARIHWMCSSPLCSWAAVKWRSLWVQLWSAWRMTHLCKPDSTRHPWVSYMLCVRCLLWHQWVVYVLCQLCV